MIIDIEKQYKQRVLNVWNKFENITILNENGCAYRKTPLLPRHLHSDSVLFIGCNPSFNDKNVIQNTQIEFYEIDKEKKDIPYFEKIKEIISHCGNTIWSHIDMLFLRETNQKIVEILTYSNKDFIQEQIDIVFEIIDKSSPKLIIVVNALASEFFGKKKAKHAAFDAIWKGYSLDFKNDFDKEIGTYKIYIGGKYTPIIFSGMLSGQRALDLGSFERLIWQINRILERQI